MRAYRPHLSVQAIFRRDKLAVGALNTVKMVVWNENGRKH